MSIFRIAIPAYVIFDVKAATKEEALRTARSAVYKMIRDYDLAIRK